MQGHVKAIAIIYMVMGGLLALGGLMMMLFFGGLAGAGIASGEPDGEAAAGVLGILGGFLFVGALIMSLPSILAGWGLLKYKPWARILTIVLAALNLFWIPIGTILGIYALWVMLNKDTMPLFESTGSGGGMPARI